MNVCQYVYLYYVHLWVEPIVGHTEAFHVFSSPLLSLSISLFLFFRTVQSGIFSLTVLLWYHNWRMPIKQSVSHFVMLIISGTYNTYTDKRHCSIFALHVCISNQSGTTIGTGTGGKYELYI